MAGFLPIWSFFCYPTQVFANISNICHGFIFEHVFGSTTELRKFAWHQYLLVFWRDARCRCFSKSVEQVWVFSGFHVAVSWNREMLITFVHRFFLVLNLQLGQLLSFKQYLVDFSFLIYLPNYIAVISLVLGACCIMLPWLSWIHQLAAVSQAGGLNSSGDVGLCEVDGCELLWAQDGRKQDVVQLCSINVYNMLNDL